MNLLPPPHGPRPSPLPQASRQAVAKAANAANTTTTATTATTATMAAGIPAATPAGHGATAAAWEALVLNLDGVLADLGPDTGWLARLLALREQALRLTQHGADAALYHLVHAAGHDPRHYSSRHGLLCCVLARESATLLGWDAPMVGSLELAALTMNTAMLGLQDDLALQSAQPTPSLRATVARHAERSAAQLRHAGVADARWVAIVRLHHDTSTQHQRLGDLDPVQRAARLLRRVDLFTAKLACRGGRSPLSPVRAAREVCTGPDGMPDEVGTAVLKAVGLYPPGSMVQLTSGEQGVVVARGPRANLPTVAVLRRADGTVCTPPLLRATHDRRYAVAGALPAGSLPAPPAYETVMPATP